MVVVLIWVGIRYEHLDVRMDCALLKPKASPRNPPVLFLPNHRLPSSSNHAYLLHLDKSLLRDRLTTQPRRPLHLQAKMERDTELG